MHALSHGSPFLISFCLIFSENAICRICRQIVLALSAAEKIFLDALLVERASPSPSLKILKSFWILDSTFWMLEKLGKPCGDKSKSKPMGRANFRKPSCAPKPLLLFFGYVSKSKSAALILRFTISAHFWYNSSSSIRSLHGRGRLGPMLQMRRNGGYEIFSHALWMGSSLNVLFQKYLGFSQCWNHIFE